MKSRSTFMKKKMMESAWGLFIRLFNPAQRPTFSGSNQRFLCQLQSAFSLGILFPSVIFLITHAKSFAFSAECEDDGERTSCHVVNLLTQTQTFNLISI
ncbi:hypothetical protein CDAR_435271 [Caerostris darwini]|uniref:Uncharacterized protein n=1 Tax=Caerostris darwini TaxID=1538125 RepID=A0AAV4SJD1_9ARAC|nr:hypothetical protein CDAR_435271 [Caerostris darwini]